jgi:hypothetical protein
MKLVELLESAIDSLFTNEDTSKEVSNLLQEVKATVSRRITTYKKLDEAVRAGLAALTELGILEQKKEKE